LLKTVVLGKVLAVVVVGKALVVPRVHPTAAAQHNPVVLALEVLEAAAGTPAVVEAVAVGLAAEAAERMTILAALMPVVVVEDLHMQTRL
tara:strand:+ start:263 stop:532 length:270 start_codon:yes stop_codon:yes gene_type:complete